jgi:hypothetical protein
MKFPISFEDFIKDPIKAIMFLVLVGIVFLYIDNRMVYKEQIEAQKSRITKLEGEVQKLQEDIVKLAKECD